MILDAERHMSRRSYPVSAVDIFVAAIRTKLEVDFDLIYQDMSQCECFRKKWMTRTLQ